MAISKDLLEIVVCPVDKAKLTVTPEEDGLKCSACGRVYPVRDGIPVLLVDEARQDAP